MTIRIALIWQARLHNKNLGKKKRHKWQCWMYMQNFVQINKKIKHGGSILSMSKGDQLDHFWNFSVFAGSQSHLCFQHILQRSIFSSFECYQVVWLSIPRLSLPHPQLPCCAIWCMPSTHLQSRFNFTINKGSPWSATLLVRHQSATLNIFTRCLLQLGKVFAFFSLWFMDHRYETRLLKVDSIN